MAVSALTVIARPSHSTDPSAPTTTTIKIHNTAKVTETKRIGVNIGRPDQYGAANYLKNVLNNPGFEGGEIGMIFHVEDGATDTRIQHDVWNTNWNSAIAGQPPNFWNGGVYEVLYGADKGLTGRIDDFTHEDDKLSLIHI